MNGLKTKKFIELWPNQKRTRGTKTIYINSTRIINVWRLIYKDTLFKNPCIKTGFRIVIYLFHTFECHKSGARENYVDFCNSFVFWNLRRVVHCWPFLKMLFLTSPSILTIYWDKLIKHNVHVFYQNIMKPHVIIPMSHMLPFQFNGHCQLEVNRFIFCNKCHQYQQSYISLYCT